MEYSVCERPVVHPKISSSIALVLLAIERIRRKRWRIHLQDAVVWMLLHRKTGSTLINNIQNETSPMKISAVCINVHAHAQTPNPLLCKPHHTLTHTPVAHAHLENLINTFHFSKQFFGIVCFCFVFRFLVVSRASRRRLQEECFFPLRSICFACLFSDAFAGTMRFQWLRQTAHANCMAQKLWINFIRFGWMAMNDQFRVRWRWPTPSIGDE